MQTYKWFRYALLILIIFPLVFPRNNAQADAAHQDATCLSLNTEKELHQFENGTNDYIETVQSYLFTPAVWSPDGKKIAFWVQRIDITKVISDPENWLHILDAANGKTIAALPFEQYSYPSDIEWSNDSTKLAVAYSNIVRVWEGGLDWSSFILKLRNRFRFEQVMWSEDANQLYTTYTNPSGAAIKPEGILQFANVLQRWDRATGSILEESPMLDQVFLTTNGTQRLIISNVDKQLSVRDAETSKVLWSQIGTYFAGSVLNNQVQRLATVKAILSTKARIATFSIWDITANQNLLDVSGEYRPEIKFAPKGNLFEIDLRAIGSDMWNVVTGQKIMLPSIKNYTWLGTFWSPNGDCAISIGEKYLNAGNGPARYSILLWSVDDPQNGHLLAESERGYDDFVWSPDGKQIAVIERTPAAKNPKNIVSPPLEFSSKLVIWSVDN